MKHLEAEADLMQNLFNDAWAKNWGFTPMLRDEVRTMMKEFRPFLREDFGVFIERNGEAVAFGSVLAESSTTWRAASADACCLSAGSDSPGASGVSRRDHCVCFFWGSAPTCKAAR